MYNMSMQVAYMVLNMGPGLLLSFEWLRPKTCLVHVLDFREKRLQSLRLIFFSFKSFRVK